MNTANVTSPAVTETAAFEAIRLAQIRLENGYLPGAMLSSARLCVDEALSCFNAGDFTSAARRAVTSLRYSVGVFHGDHGRAMDLAGMRARTSSAARSSLR